MNTLDEIMAKLSPTTSDRICEDVNRRMEGSFWSMIPKIEWTGTLSDQQRVLTLERSLPTNTEDWLSEGYSSVGIPPKGVTQRTYRLVQKASESDKISVNDPVSRMAEVIEDHIRGLAYTLHRRAVVEYSRLAEIKSIAGVGVVYGEAFHAVMPTEKFSTQGINMNAFPLTPEMVISRGLAPKEFNEGYLPRRWCLMEDKWFEVEPFESDGRTLSEAWKRAEVEDTYLFSPDVMNVCIPKVFEKKDEPLEKSTVDTRWKNVVVKDPESFYYNPDGATGFFRTLIMSATKPIHPEIGVVIRHLR